MTTTRCFRKSWGFLLKIRDNTRVYWSGKHRPALTGQLYIPAFTGSAANLGRSRRHARMIRSRRHTALIKHAFQDASSEELEQLEIMLKKIGKRAESLAEKKVSQIG